MHDRCEAPVGDRVLDVGRDDARRRDGDVHSPRLVEEPFVLRIVHACDDSLDAEFGFCQERDDEVDLVVARRRHDDVGLVEIRPLEARELAGVVELPLRLGDGGHFHRRGVAVDDRDVVAGLDELLGDRPAHGPGPRDDDFHRSSWAGWFAILWTAPARSVSTVMCSASPSCSTRLGAGSIPLPKRVR